MRIWYWISLSFILLPLGISILAGVPLFDEPEDPLIFMLFVVPFLFFLKSLDKSEPEKEKDEGMTEAEMLHEEMSEGEYDEILDEIKTKKKRKKRLNLHSTRKSNTRMNRR